MSLDDFEYTKRALVNSNWFDVAPEVLDALLDDKTYTRDAVMRMLQGDIDEVSQVEPVVEPVVELVEEPVEPKPGRRGRPPKA